MYTYSYTVKKTIQNKYDIDGDDLKIAMVRGPSLTSLLHPVLKTAPMWHGYWTIGIRSFQNNMPPTTFPLTSNCALTVP